MAKKETRVDQVKSMIARKTGATAKQIADRFDLEEHTVRAMISRLDIEIVKRKEGNKPTVYMIPANVVAGA